MPTIEVPDDELAGVTAALGASSRTTSFLFRRGSIRCGLRWRGLRRLQSQPPSRRSARTKTLVERLPPN